MPNTVQVNAIPSETEKQASRTQALSISAVTLAAAFATAGAEAQSNQQCQTFVGAGNLCLEPISVTPFVTPFDERDRVPYYQPDDPRDFLSDRDNNGGGGGTPPPNDDPDDDPNELNCISTSVVTDLVLLSETEQFIASSQAQANWASGIAGIAAGAATGLISQNALVGSIVGFVTGQWINHVLSPGFVHCGDRITVEITLCPNEPSPIDAFEDAPFTIQAIDTNVDHIHERCVDDYTSDPGVRPRGAEHDFDFGTKYTVSLPGITHVFSTPPSDRDLVEILEYRKNLTGNSDLNAYLHSPESIEALIQGFEMGIQAYKELAEDKGKEH